MGQHNKYKIIYYVVLFSIFCTVSRFTVPVIEPVVEPVDRYHGTGSASLQCPVPILVSRMRTASKASWQRRTP